MELKMMTFNLRVNTPVDGNNAWPYRFQGAAGVILEADPVVWGAQEAQYAMLSDLDKELPGYSRIGTGRSGQGPELMPLDECCAIYFKPDCLTLLDQGQFWLSETPDVPGTVSWDSSFPRICTWGLFQSNEEPGVRFYVFNTHLDHIGQRAREESARILLERMHGNEPAVLMGDFNAEPDNPAIQTLRRELGYAYDILQEPVGRTFHAYKGGTDGEPIDYLFASGGAQFVETTVHREKRQGVYPSDHYPVSAVVRFG